jgi:GNAT superfamily N-acetyltransferase
MIVIRRGDRLDVPFLRSLLAHAYGRHASALETFELEVPVGCYVENWGRRGDTALIAMDDGHPVGAAWYRLFSEDAHGYGFIDPATPEVTVVVVPSRQGEGIGQQLLARLLSRAEADGYPALSASVESDDPALESLAEQGFEVISQQGVTLTMRRLLGSTATRA